MTKAIRLKMAEEDSKKESVSDGAKPTSICGFFLKAGKCYRANCKFSHKINTEEKCENLREKGSGDCLDSATKPPPTYLPEECNPVHNEKMPSSQVNSEMDRVGRLHQEINEEELCESLKCEMLENCTPQFCSTCQEEFSSELDSKSHYAGKPHQKLLQMKLKVMLRKKIREDNLRKKQGDSELINSATISTEIEQIVTTEMSEEKNSIKEETRKRPGDHLDEDLCVVDNKYERACELPSNLLETCQPNYCGVCFTYLNKNNSRPHYAGKPHKKKLKLLEMERNPNKYTCDVCHVSVTNEDGLKMHLIGKPHAKKLKWMQLTPEIMDGNKASFVCEVCGIKTVDTKSLEMHLRGSDHRAQVAKKEEENKSKSEKVDSWVSFVVEENQEKGIAVEAEKAVTLGVKKSLSNSESILMQTEIMMNKNTNEKSVNMAEEMDDGRVEDSMSKISSDGKPGKENMVEEMENTFSVESKLSLSDTESMPVQAAVIMNENSVMIDEKMDDCEARDIPDLSDLKVRKLAGHNNADTEFMSTQTTVMINENTSEKSVIKDEEMDDGEAKDIPYLCDSMSNLAGYGDIIKNNELKITLNLKEKELLHPSEIVKTPTSETLQKEDTILVTENIEVKKSTQGDDKREEEASSDDDLIILDNPDSLSPRKSIQNTQNLNNAPLAESVKLCVYPLGQSESVTVSTQDYATLAYDTFLNDIIIDFYLLYLANNVLSNSDRDKVHIFSTMFYKRLMQSPRADAKKVPDYENDVTLTSAEIRHFRVASWTKSVDLFEKDMIIIPICEESHWYLLLVVKPGIIFLPFKSKERKERGEPFMIVLDSVGGSNNTAVKNIRRYLACEWNKKKCDRAELLSNLEKMGKKIDTLRPNKPEQENNSDCGIFLLQYVDKVFQNVSAFLWPFLVNSRTREWFTSEEVAGKRGEIAHLIKRLTKEQKPEEVIYPNIKFTAKGV